MLDRRISINEVFRLKLNIIELAILSLCILAAVYGILTQHFNKLENIYKNKYSSYSYVKLMEVEEVLSKNFEKSKYANEETKILLSSVKEELDSYELNGKLVGRILLELVYKDNDLKNSIVNPKMDNYKSERWEFNNYSTTSIEFVSAIKAEEFYKKLNTTRLSRFVELNGRNVIILDKKH